MAYVPAQLMLSREAARMLVVLAEDNDSTVYSGDDIDFCDEMGTTVVSHERV